MTPGARNITIRNLGRLIVPAAMMLLVGCAPEAPPEPVREAPPTPIYDARDQWRRTLIDPDLGENAVFVTAAEIDEMDGPDLIAGRYWYVNPGSINGIWQRNRIGEPLRNMAAVFDIDRDGFQDILGTRGRGAAPDARFVWARNTGFGRFTILNVYPYAEGDFLSGIVVTDIDDNGDTDILLSWHGENRGVQQYAIPDNPLDTGWDWRVISEFSQNEDLSLGDIDQDGDLDLFLGTVWLEHDTEGPEEWIEHVVGETTAGIPDRNDLADFDGDGDLDAIVGLENGDDILLFLAPDNPRGLWSRSVLLSGLGGGFSMDADDVDRDGDVDVVIGEHRGTTSNRVLILENRYRGVRWNVLLVDEGPIDTIDHHDGTQFADMDGDGDLDIISIGWYNPKVWIYENLAFDPGRRRAPVRR